MNYCPHILQKKTLKEPEHDEFGRPVPGTGGEQWMELCRCRCDNNTTKEFTSPNGAVYRPAYHVVAEKVISITEGDEVRCMDGDSIRGKGKVFMVKNLNYFGYSELWVE